MKTVTYQGDGLTIEITLQRPTVVSGLLHAIILQALRESERTLLAQGVVSTFANMIKHTQRIDGVALTLPRWNSTADEIMASFIQWLELPEAVGDFWQEQVRAFINDDSPLATAPNELPTSVAQLLVLPLGQNTSATPI